MLQWRRRGAVGAAASGLFRRHVVFDRGDAWAQRLAALLFGALRACCVPRRDPVIHDG